MTWVFISYFVLLTIIYDLLKSMGWGLDMFWEILKFILGQEKIMDKKWMIVIGVVVVAVVVYFATCGCGGVA